jgi:hypothetical protein
MAEALATHPTDEALFDARKQKLAEMLKVKLEQGYRIESQGDTEAVLFTKGQRSWLGLFGSGEGARQIISVDDEGRAKTRKLSPSGTSESGRETNPLDG